MTSTMIFLERESKASRTDRDPEGPEYLSELIDAFNDPNVLTLSPRDAEEALWNIQGSLDFALWEARAPLDLRVRAVGVLPKMIDSLLLALSPSSAALRSFWPGLLATPRIDDPTLMSALLRALEGHLRSRSQLVKEGALEALGLLASEDAVVVLERYLASPNLSADLEAIAHAAVRQCVRLLSASQTNS